MNATGHQPKVLLASAILLCGLACNFELPPLGSTPLTPDQTMDPPADPADPPPDDPTDPTPPDDPAEPPPVDDPPDPTPPDDPDPLPSNGYCDAVAEWPAEWAAFEQQVVELMNARRTQGADCGSAGVFPPAEPLGVDPALTCAARNHSRDMNEREFFNHTNPDGDGPAQRIRLAGYLPQTWGENIARGYGSPQSVVEGWMNSDGHCANIMRGFFTEVGIGFYEGNYWTAAFGDD